MDLVNAVWRTSSRSGNGGNCVEVATNVQPGVAVRDSKNRSGAVLIVGRAEWDAFLTGIRDGRFDL